jgi:hypothetical protein
MPFETFKADMVSNRYMLHDSSVARTEEHVVAP